VSLGDNVKIINKDGLKNYQSELITIRDGVIIIEKNAVIEDGFEI
jgi:hypothetical protein